MEDQRKALDLHPGDRLLDLGGGTGNFVEHLLQSGRTASGPDHPGRPDSRKPSRRPVRKLAARDPSLRRARRLAVLALDVELNRFIPVRRFLGGRNRPVREIGRASRKPAASIRHPHRRGLLAPPPPDPPGRGNHPGNGAPTEGPASTSPNTGSSGISTRPPAIVREPAPGHPIFRRLAPSRRPRGRPASADQGGKL